jgi:Domain of unknown function (DUF4129)
VLVAALLVLLGAVALTAGMSRPAAETAQGFSLPPAALLAWGMAAAVVGGLALAVLMPAWTGREKWTAAMLGALLLLGFAILTERQHADQVATAPQQQVQVTHAPQPSSTTSAPQSVPLPGVQRAPASRGPAALAPWLIAVIGAAALLLALLALGRGGRGRGGEQRATVAALDAAMAASMRDVEREADPRRAIVAAWLSMGEVLARRGRRRQQHEAPLEYLRRCLDAMHVSRTAAERLTALFQRARYSDHPATEAMRSEALDALRDVREDLQREGGS